MTNSEFGLRHLENVSAFADKLDRLAAGTGISQPGLRGDLQRAASELRQLVLLLRAAMGATEGIVVISLDAEARVVVSTTPVQ